MVVHDRYQLCAASWRPIHGGVHQRNVVTQEFWGGNVVVRRDAIHRPWEGGHVTLRVRDLEGSYVGIASLLIFE